MFKFLLYALVVVGLTACGGGSSQLDTSATVPTGVTALATSDSKVGVSWAPQTNAKSYFVITALNGAAESAASQ